MRTLFIFGVLLAVKAFSRLFFRHHLRWVDPVPEDPWGDIRLVALLNHTSLFEWLFAGSVPNRFLWRIASHAVIPAADKTLKRPVVGHFFRMLGQHVIPITRRPDESWRQVLARIDPQGMVIILPEGRMMRRNGLDAEGRPMTVRGGVADILQAIPEGRMLYGYSGGLHHVQIPGQRMPRLFRSIDLTIENLGIPEYRDQLTSQTGRHSFKEAMKADMERRRDLWAVPFSRAGKLQASRT